MNKQDKLKALLKDFSKAELIEFLIDDTDGEEKVSDPEPEQVEERLMRLTRSDEEERAVVKEGEKVKGLLREERKGTQRDLTVEPPL